MLFVTMVKMKTKIDEAFNEKLEELMLKPPEGVDFHELFYTLGQYDILMCYEAPDEKGAMNIALAFAGKATTETAVAIPLEDARQLIKKHVGFKR